MKNNRRYLDQQDMVGIVLGIATLIVWFVVAVAIVASLIYLMVKALPWH